MADNDTAEANTDTATTAADAAATTEATSSEDTTIVSEAGEKNSDDSAPSKDTTTPASDSKEDKEKTADDKDDAAKSKDAKSDEEVSDGDEADATRYDDLAVQEGMEVDEVALGSFKELAAGMNDGKGLSKEDAQSLVDFRAEMVKANVDEWDATFSEWRGEIHSDKEIGGDKFVKETIPNVLAAAEKYGDAEMVKLIRTNKMYGENPSLLRLLNRVGATLREDKHIPGGRPVTPTKDAAETLYGKE